MPAATRTVVLGGKNSRGRQCAFWSSTHDHAPTTGGVVVTCIRRSAAALSTIGESKRATITVPTPYVAPSRNSAPDVVVNVTPVCFSGTTVENRVVLVAVVASVPRPVAVN